MNSWDKQFFTRKGKARILESSLNKSFEIIYQKIFNSIFLSLKLK
jgi:hypothetical protein